MDPTGLIPALIGVVDRALGRRQRLRMRADTAERMLASFYPYDDASTLTSRYGLILVYNGGPGWVTVNEAGWEATDGSRVEAYVPPSARSNRATRS